MASPRLDEAMHHVYPLRSVADPKQTYIGLTEDMRARLKSHNGGANLHTARYRPWEVVCCISFQSRERAAEFERCLKAGSGQKLARRRVCLSRQNGRIQEILRTYGPHATLLLNPADSFAPTGFLAE